MKLVIIDDEMWSREVVKKLIHFDKLKLELVGEADNGIDGLNLIENLKPDIVITDMKMPGLDGLQVLKKLSKYPHIKTIVMSGFDDYEYLRQAIHSKAIEYLLKPIKEEDINAAIERCLNELILVNEKVLTSNRIFTDEHDHLDYLSIMKRLQLAIIKKNVNTMSEVLDEMNKFNKYINSTDMIKKLKDNLLNQLQQYLHQQNIDYSINTPNLECNSLDEMIKQIIPVFEKVIQDITSPKDRTSLDIIDIKQFIDQHHMYPISLDDVAETFYVSKEHVSRLFSKKFHQSVTQYILKKKMDHAADLIITSQLNYREIAFITGFEDISYFYKQFKKHFQCTPGEYKSQH